MLKRAFLSLALLCLASPAFAQDGAKYKAILDSNADSIVTIRAVVKVEIPSQNLSQEGRVSLQGCVVGSDGLIMLSNSPISSDRIVESLGDRAPAGFELHITPIDFKVTFGNEEKEYEAYFVAKDTKLDLAFIQVKALEGRKLKPVSMTSGAKPTVGEELIIVNRMTKGHDYAPQFTLSRVTGKIKKPRKCWNVDNNAVSIGLPVFNKAGQSLGVLITLSAGPPESGGIMDQIQGRVGNGIGIFMLPAKVVSKTIEQAKTKAAELKKEEASKPKETKPGATDKKAEESTSKPK